MCEKGKEKAPRLDNSVFLFEGKAECSSNHVLTQQHPLPFALHFAAHDMSARGNESRAHLKGLSHSNLRVIEAQSCAWVELPQRSPSHPKHRIGRDDVR